MSPAVADWYSQRLFDIFWIIALWYLIHGGDPLKAAEDTLLNAGSIAAGLSGVLGAGIKTTTGNVGVEELAKVGARVFYKRGEERVDIKTTKHWHELIKAGGKPPIIPCLEMNGHVVCSGPWWPPVKIPHNWPL